MKYNVNFEGSFSVNYNYNLEEVRILVKNILEEANSALPDLNSEIKIIKIEESLEF